MSSRDLEVGLNIRMRDSASQPAQAAERNVQRTVQQTAQTYTDASRVAVTTSRMVFDLRRQQSAQAERTVQATAQQTAKTYVDTSRVAITSSTMMFNLRRQQAVQTAQAVTQAAQQSATAQVQAQAQASRIILNTSQRLAAARSQLDIRSERTIRREIDQTIAAYSRLARAGFASAAEQNRAIAATRSRVAELRRELVETAKTESRLGRGIGTAWKVTGAAVGVGAAGMVVAPAVHQSMAYDRRLAEMANTAYSDRDVAGRRQGAHELDVSIRHALRVGGGTPDQAADTLDTMLASGAISGDSANKLLPTLQKYSTAAVANPNELANIAIRAMQNFNIKENEIPQALDMALKGGQEGGFELRDMSKWLPQQMALAKQVGMSGLKDFGNLVVANQASVVTAGTKDEAGNNLVNLLEKINSQDTQIKAKKLGIDLTGSLASSRAKGTNALDAFVGIVQRVMNHDKRYTSAQARLAKAPEGERKAILESQVNLLEGTSVGKLVHDRQALGALVAYMGQADYRKQVSEKVFDPAPAVETNFAGIKETPSFKVEQANNEMFFGRMDAMSGLNDKIGKAAQNLSDYAEKYPGLTQAIAGTTLAFQGVTAAIAPLAVFALLRGGGAAAAGAAGAAGAALPGAVAGAGSAAGAAGFGSRFVRVARLGGPVGVGFQLLGGGIEAASIAGDDSLTADQKKARYAGVAGGVAGGLGGMAAGAALGAAAGSVVPGIGTAVGLVAGGVAGYFGHDFGERLGKMIGDAIFTQKKEEKPPVIEGHITVNLDGQHLFDSISTMTTRAAQRN